MCLLAILTTLFKRLPLPILKQMGYYGFHFINEFLRKRMADSLPRNLKVQAHLTIGKYSISPLIF